MTPPKKFGDLKFEAATLHGRKVFLYRGTTSPNWQELNDARADIVAGSYDLLRMDGFTGIPGGPPPDKDARGCNGIMLDVGSNKNRAEFLTRPIPPSLKDISLELRTWDRKIYLV